MLLGDQLIRDAGIAVFELIKNAHDADATHAKVTISDIADRKKGRIQIEDDGSGMDWITVSGIWLEPATDHRAVQKFKRMLSPIFKRLPLGEKGIGRFAAHKLGTKIRLITRKKGCPEVVVEINWDDFDESQYLDQVKNTVRERDPLIFKGNSSGTRIEISGLRQEWDRRMIRDLARSITSICSPFDGPDNFQADLFLTDHRGWLDGVLTAEDVDRYALYRAKCTIQGKSLKYDYTFEPWKVMDRVRARKVVGKTVKISRLNRKDPRPIDLDEHSIGPVMLRLRIYDLDHKLLALGVTDKRGLKEYLDENGGVRVYRDGIRVFDYGEPGNDWLDLEGRRVNQPAARIGNNLVVGAVELVGDSSQDLIEKTNREGFVINEAYKDVVEALSFAVTQIQAERSIDKEHIRLAYSSKQYHDPVLEDLGEIQAIARKKGIEGDLRPYLKRIESDFIDIRDRFLTSASAGLSLTIVIHEVEKGLSELRNAVVVEPVAPRVKKLAKHLCDLVEGLAAIARHSGSSDELSTALIRQALFNTELRLKHHKTRISVDTKLEFRAKCSKRLIIATLMNLIDNSLYWLREQAPAQKEIRVFTTRHLRGGLAIVVADNNTQGFIDPPEMVVRPFFTRRPDGMGLGLHLAEQVMKVQGGSIQFPEPGDVGLPPEFKAVVALVFGDTHG